MTIRSDPSDPDRQIIKYIRCSSNEWVRVSDRGGNQFIFVPRGYCAVDSGPGLESPVGSQSLEVVSAKDFSFTGVVSRDSFISLAPNIPFMTTKFILQTSSYVFTTNLMNFTQHFPITGTSWLGQGNGSLASTLN